MRRSYKRGHVDDMLSCCAKAIYTDSKTAPYLVQEIFRTKTEELWDRKLGHFMSIRTVRNRVAQRLLNTYEIEVS